MGSVLELGAASILAMIFWILVFFVGTLVVNLFVVLRCRKMLKKGGRPTRGTTLLLVLVLCLLLPFTAAYFGFSFALQRSAANALNRSTDKLVELAVEHGVALAKKRFAIRDDAAPIDVDAVRKHARAQREASGGGVIGALESTWWWAVDAALAEGGDRVKGYTWRDVEELAKPLLAKEGKKLFGKLSDGFRSSAMTNLYVFVSVLLVLDLLALILVRRHARKPKAPPAPPEPAAPPKPPIPPPAEVA